MRDDVLQCNEDIVQRQAGLHAHSDDRRFLDGREGGTVPLLRPIGSSSTVSRDRHFLTVFSLIPKRRASSALPKPKQPGSAKHDPDTRNGRRVFNMLMKTQPSAAATRYH